MNFEQISKKNKFDAERLQTEFNNTLDTPFDPSIEGASEMMERQAKILAMGFAFDVSDKAQ